MPIFFCNSNPRNLVESFIDAVEGLATQSKAQMKLKILEVETAIKKKLTRTPESLIEHRCRNQWVFECEDECFEDDNEEKVASTQFLQMQKYQWLELQEHLERYCNVSLVFGFNTAKHDINLIRVFFVLYHQLVFYPFSSMRGIWNLLWLKKATNLCLLILVTFSF